MKPFISQKMSVTFAVGEASSAHAKSEEISNDWLDRLTVPLPILLTTVTE